MEHGVWVRGDGVNELVGMNRRKHISLVEQQDNSALHDTYPIIASFQLNEVALHKSNE